MAWRSSEVLAWTSGDGPGRPPRGPSVVLTGPLAATLGVSHVAMLLSDTLCPEHRSWVFVLAGAALVASVVAVVGLLRGAASSALWTVLAAGCGVAIGIVDAAHDPARGRLIAVVFAVAAFIGAVLAAWQLVLWRWERRTVASLRSDPVALPDPVENAPEEEPDASSATEGPAHDGDPVARGGG